MRAVVHLRACLIITILLVFGYESFGRDFGASLKVGTPGLGADVTVNLWEDINLRVGINYFSYSMDFDDDDDDDNGGDENITLSLDLQSFPLLLDWHPFKNNFRASAGLFFNGNKIGLKAEAGDTIDINDVEYEIDDFSISVDFNQICPYLGIGYGNGATGNRRFVFAFDFGVMFQGAPDISARATAVNPDLQAALDRDLDEEVKDIEDDFSFLGFFPVISFGLSYRF